ncbi:hypothetical protein LTR60_001595 [Cryomyces antarcticus]|nr:hypothetical protein LTR39_001735 [Cryomyces antarcticus]KAK5018215.1 hypothetical protein LTR60_001595 [Cryomyces antarcticus]
MATYSARMAVSSTSQQIRLGTVEHDASALLVPTATVPLQLRLNAVREAEHRIQLAQTKLFMKEVRIREVRQRLDAATAKLRVESEFERAEVLAGWHRLQREKQQFRREREDATRWGSRDWKPHDHDPFESFVAGDSEGADEYAFPSSSWSRRSKSPPWDHNYESGFNPGRGRPPQPGFAQYHDPGTSPRSPVEAGAEARAMFDAYDASWSQISRTDPAVAWPTCDLSAATLLDRCSIPSRTIHKRSTTTWQNPWSAELVMKANTQAFFLRAFGLRPTYDEDDHSLRVTMGFARASMEQMQRLLSCLKKEYLRWHSDRLRHRNGGAGGYNEALVTDARARAVLHGIVELKHVCEERLRGGDEGWTFV